MSQLQRIPRGDLFMPAMRWEPAKPNGAAVVVVQEIFGLSDYIADRCADLAADGYLVLAPQLYWRLDEPPVFDADSPDYVMQGVNAATALDWQTTVDDVCATMDALRLESDRVGLLGFCFGGGVAFNAAAQDSPDALVCYYGSALPQLTGLADKVSAPQLHHFGTADAYIDLDAQAKVRAAVESGPGLVIWREYAGAGHAFDNPLPAFVDPVAREAAWKATEEFLQKHLVASHR